MRDLQIHIGGPRDRARQQVSFSIAQQAAPRGLDASQIGELIGQLRVALTQSELPSDDRRRVERQLAAIEEEAQSEQPLLSEITGAMTFLGKLVESTQGLAPLFSSTYRLLATAVGLSPSEP